MNNFVPEYVEMICERVTWKTWKGTESNFPRGSTELVLWLHAEGSNSDQFPSDQFPSFPVSQFSSDQWTVDSFGNNNKHGDTLKRILPLGAPTLRLFPTPRLLDLGPGKHPPHDTSITRKKNTFEYDRIAHLPWANLFS